MDFLARGLLVPSLEIDGLGQSIESTHVAGEKTNGNQMANA
jgi:hypothetical protein